MEVGRRPRAPQHHDGCGRRWKLSAPTQPLGRQFREIDMGDLARGVHAGIGAAGGDDRHGLAGSRRAAPPPAPPGPTGRWPGAASPGTARRHTRAAGGSAASAQPSRVPDGSGKPRSSSSGVMGRRPARWTRVSAIALPCRRRSSAARRARCRARRRRRRARRRAASAVRRGIAPAAGPRVERPQPAVDQRRRARRSRAGPPPWELRA